MKFKTIKTKSELLKSDKCDGYLLDTSEKEARRIIESLRSKGKTIAVLGGDDAFNRRAVETLKINYLVSPESGPKKDTLKQRDSGLNHVVAKEAAKRGIGIVIDFDEISKMTGKAKALRLARIIQNVKICRRAKCKLLIWDLSEKTNKKELEAFGFSIGMSSVMVRETRQETTL